LAYVEDGTARLVSRNGNTFKTFPGLTAAIGPATACRNAVLDGEIVHLAKDGTPDFFALMRRRTPQHFCAFDLLWLDGRDVRGLPLTERKRLLRRIVPRDLSPVLYVDHVEGRGVDLFQAVCEADMEGIVAKRASGLYTPDETSWVKIKNRSYSQMEGRWEWFEERHTRTTLVRPA
jgi:bifunctional non-homologous end joining protein LigD